MIQRASSEAAAGDAHTERRELVWRHDAAEPEARHRHLQRACGPLYNFCWHAEHGQQAEQWLAGKIVRRRWLPAAGEEWNLLPLFGGFMEAFHILRLLAGGLGRAAGLRTAETHTLHPKQCAVCGSALPQFT